MPAGESLLEGAKRELAEETGYHARDWREIVRFATSNSVTDEEGALFVATGLEAGDARPDGSEQDLVSRWVSLDEAVAMIDRGEITDAMSQVALLRVALERRTEPGLEVASADDEGTARTTGRRTRAGRRRLPARAGAAGLGPGRAVHARGLDRASGSPARAPSRVRPLGRGGPPGADLLRLRGEARDGRARGARRRHQPRGRPDRPPGCRRGGDGRRGAAARGRQPLARRGPTTRPTRARPTGFGSCSIGSSRCRSGRGSTSSSARPSATSARRCWRWSGLGRPGSRRSSRCRSSSPPRTPTRASRSARSRGAWRTPARTWSA